jgi:simple sugar transport system substrate-binding protein
MKRYRDWLALAVRLALLLTVAGCTQGLIVPSGQNLTPAGEKPQKTYKDLIVGYAQLGAESEWRSANTASVKQAAADLGVELKFSDAQQKQENQIKAIRSFIAQKVDVIGVAPS